MCEDLRLQGVRLSTGKQLAEFWRIILLSYPGPTVQLVEIITKSKCTFLTDPHRW